MNYRSEIVGTGSGFPETVMSNHDLEKFLDTSDEWIKTRTGIENRRVADPKKGETTLSMCFDAAKNAISMAKMDPKELDMIVIGTVTPESVMPTTANYLQAKLGASRAFSFDLQAACSGFLYGLGIADQFIRCGNAKSALVVGAETLSTIVNWRDRGTAVLFGDGAGAVVLRRTDDLSRGVVATKLYSDGTESEILCVRHGYCRVPPYSPDYRTDMSKVAMQGADVFKLAVRRMVEASQALLEEQKVSAKDVNYFIFHQANMRIIDMCMKALNVPREKTWINLEKYGNTSAATLPVCLDEAWKAGAVKKGDLILMATFGGGLTWGSSLIRL